MCPHPYYPGLGTLPVSAETLVDDARHGGGWRRPCRGRGVRWTRRFGGDHWSGTPSPTGATRDSRCRAHLGVEVCPRSGGVGFLPRYFRRPRSSLGASAVSPPTGVPFRTRSKSPTTTGLVGVVEARRLPRVRRGDDPDEVWREMPSSRLGREDCGLPDGPSLRPIPETRCGEGPLGLLPL